MSDRIELRTQDLIDLWRIAARAKGETGAALRERLGIVCQSWLDDLEIEREIGASVEHADIAVHRWFNALMTARAFMDTVERNDDAFVKRVYFNALGTLLDEVLSEMREVLGIES